MRVVCKEREMGFLWLEVRIAKTTFKYLLCKQKCFLLFALQVTCVNVSVKKYAKKKPKKPWLESGAW